VLPALVHLKMLLEALLLIGLVGVLELLLRTQATLSASLLARQVANINHGSGGSSQRATKDAPILNRPRHPEHDPPTEECLPYSPRERVYLPPAVEDKSVADGIEAFPDLWEQVFNAYFTASNNRKVFSLEQRDHYRRHLRNPLAGAQGYSKAEKPKDGNIRTHAIRNFCLGQE
jgi:hypothetical protein